MFNAEYILLALKHSSGQVRVGPMILSVGSVNRFIVCLVHSPTPTPLPPISTTGIRVSDRLQQWGFRRPWQCYNAFFFPLGLITNAKKSAVLTVDGEAIAHTMVSK
jgi:hypothetical protein